MEQVRWGVIGCGDIATKRVIPAMQELETCKVQAVARANSDLIEKYAKQVGADRWFLHWQNLLRSETVDAVYIATPVSFHEEQAIAAAEEGKHVLCEKPMAIDAAACERMIAACRANKVRLGVAYYRHFYPAVQRVKQIITSGEIGQVVLAQVDAFEWFDRVEGEPRSWLLNKELAGGGPMLDFGSHRIEVLQNLLGAVKSVQAQTFNLHFDRQVEDTAYVSLEFVRNAHGIIRVTHAAQEPRDTLELVGTKGTLHVPVLNEGNIIIRTADGERSEHCPPHTNFHLPLIEDFTNAVLAGRVPTVSGQIGLNVARVTDQVYGVRGEN